MVHLFNYYLRGPPTELLLIRGPASPSGLTTNRLRHDGIVSDLIPCIVISTQKRSPVDSLTEPRGDPHTGFFLLHTHTPVVRDLLPCLRLCVASPHLNNNPSSQSPTEVKACLGQLQGKRGVWRRSCRVNTKTEGPFDVSGRQKSSSAVAKDLGIVYGSCCAVLCCAVLYRTVICYCHCHCVCLFSFSTRRKKTAGRSEGSQSKPSQAKAIPRFC